MESGSESPSAAGAPAGAGAPRRRRFGWGAVLATVVALAMMVAGVVLIVRGPTHEEPPGEAMPSTPFAQKHPSASGPNKAEVGGRTITPATMGANRIFIPQLGVDAPLVDARFSGGELTIPDDPSKVARDTGSPGLSATAGVTLVAGHVRFNTTPGALKHLADVRPGARIYVSDAKGHAHGFVAASLEAYVKRKLPQEVFAHSGPRRLAVVTCGGPIVWLDGVRHFRDNVVVMAEPLKGA